VYRVSSATDWHAESEVTDLRSGSLDQMQERKKNGRHIKEMGGR
jgi:hypothetical protein